MTMDITKSVAFTGHRSERILQVRMLYLYLDIVTGAGSFPEFAVTAAGVVFPVVCRGSVRLCRAFRNENPVSNQNGRHMPVTLTTWGKKIASSFADENSHSLFNFAPGIPE